MTPLTPTCLYACPHCLATFSSPHERLRHLNTAHADPPPVTLFEKYLRRAERRFAERQAAEQKARRR